MYILIRAKVLCLLVNDVSYIYYNLIQLIMIFDANGLSSSCNICNNESKNKNQL